MISGVEKDEKEVSVLRKMKRHVGQKTGREMIKMHDKNGEKDEEDKEPSRPENRERDDKDA
jgi:hypothetical protein